MFTKALRTKPQRTTMSLTKFHRAIPPRARTRTRLIERSATNRSLVLRIHYQLPLGVPFLIQPMQRKFVHSKLTQPTVNQLESHLFPINGPSKFSPKYAMRTKFTKKIADHTCNIKEKMPIKISEFTTKRTQKPMHSKKSLRKCALIKPPKTNSIPAESTSVTS